MIHSLVFELCQGHVKTDIWLQKDLNSLRLKYYKRFTTDVGGPTTEKEQSWFKL
jgi:hypothetical protein